MALVGIPRTALVDRAVQQLEDQLRGGAWEVGSRLPSEQSLAEQLGVGRSTVREAIRVLASNGLVEPRQGSGTFIRSLTGNERRLGDRLRRAAIQEVYEVRHGLETQAARLAAVRRTDAHLDVLDSTLARRRHARSAGRVAAFIDADLDFHRGVVAAAGNTVLSDLFDEFLGVLRAALTDLAEDPDLDQNTHDQHVALADAIRRGDADAAAAATAHHLDETEGLLQSLVDGSP